MGSRHGDGGEREMVGKRERKGGNSTRKWLVLGVRCCVRVMEKWVDATKL